MQKNFRGARVARPVLQILREHCLRARQVVLRLHCQRHFKQRRVLHFLRHVRRQQLLKTFFRRRKIARGRREPRLRQHIVHVVQLGRRHIFRHRIRVHRHAVRSGGQVGAGENRLDFIDWFCRFRRCGRFSLFRRFPREARNLKKQNRRQRKHLARRERFFCPGHLTMYSARLDSGRVNGGTKPMGKTPAMTPPFVPKLTGRK